MRNSKYKKSYNFQKLPLFSILYDDFLKFSENWDKEFKLKPNYFNFVVLGTTIPAAYLLSNIKSGHEMEATICGLL